MARKSAALLKSTPVKLSKAQKEGMAELAKRVPVEGCETQWARFLLVNTKHEELTARYDAVAAQVEKEGGTSDCPSWSAFQKINGEWLRSVSATFGAFDAYTYAVAHKDDKIDAAQAEVRAIVIESLADKLDGLTFNVNSGVLGSNIAKAIRNLVSEESSGDAPYCQDCE